MDSTDPVWFLSGSFPKTLWKPNCIGDFFGPRDSERPSCFLVRVVGSFFGEGPKDLWVWLSRHRTPQPQLDGFRYAFWFPSKPSKKGVPLQKKTNHQDFSVLRRCEGSANGSSSLAMDLWRFRISGCRKGASRAPFWCILLAC